LILPKQLCRVQLLRNSLNSTTQIRQQSPSSPKKMEVSERPIAAVSFNPSQVRRSAHLFSSNSSELQ
jgi:hypothetical protein